MLLSQGEPADHVKRLGETAPAPAAAGHEDDVGVGVDGLDDLGRAPAREELGVDQAPGEVADGTARLEVGEPGAVVGIVPVYLLLLSFFGVLTGLAAAVDERLDSTREFGHIGVVPLLGQCKQSRVVLCQLRAVLRPRRAKSQSLITFENVI